MSGKGECKTKLIALTSNKFGQESAGDGCYTNCIST